MFMKQLSVFVENKQGALAKVMALLSDNGIDVDTGIYTVDDAVNEIYGKIKGTI